jgi:hypothetical protein
MFTPMEGLLADQFRFRLLANSALDTSWEWLIIPVEFSGRVLLALGSAQEFNRLGSSYNRLLSTYLKGISTIRAGSARGQLRACKTKCGSSGTKILSIAKRTAAVEPGKQNSNVSPRRPANARLSNVAAPIS